MKCGDFMSNQRQFLRAGPALELLLPSGGGRTVGVFFNENGLASAENARCSTAFAVFVFDVTAERVVGMPDVEATVVHA